MKYGSVIEHLFKNTDFTGFFEIFHIFLIKKVDFSRSHCYTVVTWRKMVVKWSKMEEVSPCDR